jgi:thymidylate synthase
MNLWNPTQLDKMSLPPCLYGYQFYVKNINSVGYLSCKLIQRSSDIALAGSHNCAAGAVLVHLLCAIVGLKPGELIWSPSDIHIYRNQIDSVQKQLLRYPKPFPILQVINTPNNIRDFKYSDLLLLNYSPHEKIQFKMNT